MSADTPRTPTHTHEAIDRTHDPGLRSWVESAEDPGADFPIQNLPLCVFAGPDDGDDDARVGVPIGDRMIDLAALGPALLADDERLQAEDLRGWDVAQLFGHSARRRYLRQRLSRLLSLDTPDLRDDAGLRALALHELGACRLFMPFTPRDYTDFYASVHHATNVGSMFRPDNPLLPNYAHMPIGYHGRASSVVVSGAPVVRPWGQSAPAQEGDAPGFSPCAQLDYELEVGFVIGRGNELGEPIPIEGAESHVMGLCLLNDWSARDVQRWEYQPLGPFLSKNFATTIGPFVVTLEALAPFRSPRAARPPGLSGPPAHLDGEADRRGGAFDVRLEVRLSTAEMRRRGLAPVCVSASSLGAMTWTAAQMVAHHTAGGCNLSPGDLLGSGTVSGPARRERGCLLELTWDGDPWAEQPVNRPGSARTPIELPTGEKRVFLHDGDEVIIRGFCERQGFRRIGLGECRGTVRAAIPAPGPWARGGA